MSTLLLFAGPEYYPRGGALDLVGVFDSMDAARKAADDLPGDPPDGGMPAVWAHVFDLGEARIVVKWERDWWISSSTPPPGMEGGVGPWTVVLALPGVCERS
jgi:hypothetical protein